MKAKIRLNYDGFRGQCVILLLAVLSELGGRGAKKDVLACLAREHYFDLEAEDQLPFPTDPQAEPRWELLFAQAAQTCLERQCIEETAAGAWQLTPEGADLYSQTLTLFRNGTFDIHRCYLWTQDFKKRLVPDYTPTATERHRSATFYRYLEPQLTALARA